MSIKKTGIFLLVLVALGAFYYYYEIKGRAEREKAQAEAEKIFSLTSEQVSGIQLTKAGKSIKVEKVDKSWRLTEPVADEGDYQANEELLSRLLEATRSRVVEEENSDLEAFGLKEPALEVTLLTSGEKPAPTLLIGTKNPTGTGYYAKLKDNATLFLISTFLKEDIDKSAFDLRDKTVVSWATDRVTGIEVTTPSLQLKVELQGEEWQITAPLPTKADKSKINAFLDQLRSAKIKEFVEENPSDLTQYDLNPAEKTLTLFLGTDKGTKTLFFGKQDQEKKLVYAKRQEKAPVFLVETKLPEALPTSVDDWRDRTVLAFEKEQVEKLEIVSPEETIVVTKEADGNWKLTQPLDTPADQGKMNVLLWDLHGLKVKEFIAEKTEEVTAYGLDSPTWRILLWEKGKDSPLTLSVGKEAEGKDGHYAKVEFKDPIYLLAQKDVQNITKTSFDLRDKRILPFELEAVAKLQLKSPERTLLLEKDGEEWKVIQPEKATSSAWKVKGVLNKIRNLEFVQILSPSSSTEDYGFATPAADITLWGKDGKILGRLVIGKALEGEELHYARGTADGQIYTIKGEFLKDLPTEISALQG